jgi:hypothetical protein
MSTTKEITLNAAQEAVLRASEESREFHASTPQEKKIAAQLQRMGMFERIRSLPDGYRRTDNGTGWLATHPGAS